MATITGLTAERMQEIIDATIVGADVTSGHLILTLHDGSTIDAGVVAGGGGLDKVTAFPVAPADGDAVIRTDLDGSPIFTYSTENGWEQIARVGSPTVPSVSLGRSTSQSIPNTTTTALTFDVEHFDTDSLHDLSVNTHRITINTPGKYFVETKLEWEGTPNAAEAYILKNGVIVRYAARASGAGDQNLSGVFHCVAGDYFEVQVWHSQGSAVNMSANGLRSPAFDAVWLGGPGDTVDQVIEDPHVIGAAGEPAFQNGFSNYGGGGFSIAEFYEDRGRVYLKGTIQNVGSALNSKAAGTIFTLPPGYRPTEFIGLAASLNNAFGLIRVEPDGSVYGVIGNTSFISLDGLSFRI